MNDSSRANRPDRGAARALPCLPFALSLGLALCASFTTAPAARAQAQVPAGFHDRLVVSRLDRPVGIAFLSDGRLLVAEQVTGNVRLIVNERLAATDPIGTVPAVRTAGTERGLLGVAADPGWPGRPYVYVIYTSTSPEAVRISRFTLEGDVAFVADGNLTLDSATRYDLIDDVPDAQPNHNGGTLRFGPDGMLYASFGEDNAGCTAQDTSDLRGVIVRLDVSRLPVGPGGPPVREIITPPDNPFVASDQVDARLIWAYGLRNPFRFHIDPLTAELFIADVGPDSWEEIDRATPGGRNFGWPVYEGPDLFAGRGACTLVSPATTPLVSMLRSPSGPAAIISAGFCRRSLGAEGAFPAEYEGDYFFSDYFDGRLRRMSGSGDAWEVAPPVEGQPSSSVWANGFDHVSDFAFGPDGALWYCKQDVANGARSGQIRRVATGAGDTTQVGPMLAFPYPSPAIGRVHLDYTLPREARVELTILDVRGRRVRVLEPAGALPAGAYAKQWDGRDDDGRTAPPGMYIVRLRVDGRSFERRVPVFR